MTKEELITELFQYDLRTLRYAKMNIDAMKRKRFVLIFFSLIWMFFGLSSLYLKIGDKNISLILIYLGIAEFVISVWLIRKKREINTERIPIEQINYSDLEKTFDEAKTKFEKLKLFSGRNLALYQTDLFMMPFLAMLFLKDISFDNDLIEQLKVLLREKGFAITLLGLYFISSFSAVISGFKSPKRIEIIFNSEKYLTSFYYQSHISNSLINPNFKK